MRRYPRISKALKGCPLKREDCGGYPRRCRYFRDEGKAYFCHSPNWPDKRKDGWKKRGRKEADKTS